MNNTKRNERLQGSEDNIDEKTNPLKEFGKNFPFERIM